MMGPMTGRTRLLLATLFSSLLCLSSASADSSRAAPKKAPEPPRSTEQSYRGGRIPKLNTRLPPLPVYHYEYKDRYRWLPPNSDNDQDLDDDELDPDKED